MGPETAGSGKVATRRGYGQMGGFVARTISFDEGAISCVEWAGPGPDAPLLHFAHGTGLNGRTYARLLEPLASRFRIVSWDARGHGGTTLPADPAKLIDWQPYVDDLARMIRHLSPGRPALVAGHSLGGITSLEMAAAHPELVAAVMVLEPPLVPEDEIDSLNALRAEGRSRPIEEQMCERASRRRAIWPDPATAVEAYRGRGAFATWDDAWLEDFVAAGLKQVGGEWHLACEPLWEGKTYHAVSTRFWQGLERLQRPATILHGDRMSPVSPASVAAIDRIGRARRVLVPGATHFLPMEHPDIARAEILRLADEAGL